MVKIIVKWGKEKFDNIEICMGESFLDLKAKVYAATCVPVDKQKLIYKGSVLKDDANIETLKLQNGATFMLMGSAEGSKPIESNNKTVFVEDLTPEEKAKILKEKTGVVVPAGLINLGNTCYLNSTLQCFKRVNELKDFFMQSKFSTVTPEGKLAFSFQSLLKQLEKKGESFEPYEFVETFMSLFPMFNERTKEGVYKQQDADECFQLLLSSLEKVGISKDLEGDNINMIKRLFEIEFEEELKNLEVEEAPKKKKEYSKKLVCIIDNQGDPINHLAEGIKANLEETIEKISDIDNQNHTYKKTSLINKLPNYLVVQMMRFFWKKGSGVPGQQAGKAKILRNVSFPKVLDTYPYCTDQLKQVLDQGRVFEKKKHEEQAQNEVDRFELYKKELEKSGKMISEDSRETFKQFKTSLQEEEIKKHDEGLYAAHGFGLETGNYQLIGVLTHKGRSADSGHYVSWVHKSGDEWYKYDDDLVTIVKIEEVMNLRGGGDWHMAYYCIYRKLEIM